MSSQITHEFGYDIVHTWQECYDTKCAKSLSDIRGGYYVASEMHSFDWATVPLVSCSASAPYATSIDNDEGVRHACPAVGIWGTVGKTFNKTE